MYLYSTGTGTDQHLLGWLARKSAPACSYFGGLQKNAISSFTYVFNDVILMLLFPYRFLQSWISHHRKIFNRSDPHLHPNNDISQLTNCYLTDSQLLAHFNSTYPQRQPWVLVPVPPEMISSVISALVNPFCCQHTNHY